MEGCRGGVALSPAPLCPSVDQTERRSCVRLRCNAPRALLLMETSINNQLRGCICLALSAGRVNKYLFKIRNGGRRRASTRGDCACGMRRAACGRVTI